jgi:hypothetical protein
MSNEELQRAISFAIDTLSDEPEAYVKAAMQRHLVDLLCEQARRSKSG